MPTDGKHIVRAKNQAMAKVKGEKPAFICTECFKATLSLRKHSTFLFPTAPLRSLLPVGVRQRCVDQALLGCCSWGGGGGRLQRLTQGPLRDECGVHTQPDRKH